ncbi:MAG: ATP synthase F0 subunit C [Bacteroidales bacterium]
MNPFLVINDPSVAALAAAVIVIGAAIGIGQIGSKAMEGIARQPEAGNDIRSSMLIIAAFIEGVSVIALVICLLVSLK